jgi:hypothetical protein
VKNSNRLAIVGVVLLAPASVLISSSLLRCDVPKVLIHPLAVIGGLLGALAVNLLVLLRVQSERGTEGSLQAVTIRIGSGAVNLVIVAVCALLLATVLGYAFVENFRPR